MIKHVPYIFDKVLKTQRENNLIQFKLFETHETSTTMP